MTKKQINKLKPGTKIKISKRLTDWYKNPTRLFDWHSLPTTHSHREIRAICDAASAHDYYMDRLIGLRLFKYVEFTGKLSDIDTAWVKFVFNNKESTSQWVGYRSILGVAR